MIIKPIPDILLGIAIGAVAAWAYTVGAISVNIAKEQHPEYGIK